LKFFSTTLWSALLFLIQWEKVQLSGEKCSSGVETVFQGASSLSLDAKGRLSVPTRHRDVLSATADSQLTLTKHPHGCLMVFPRPEWEKFRARIAALPMDAQWWKRIFLGNAMDVEMDGTGRVLVSPELRAAAGIQKDAVLLGMGGYFELWDATTYAAKEAEAMKAAMPDVFKDFSF
jgi:MraZ protein